MLRNRNTNYERVNRLVNISTVVLLDLIWLGSIVFLRLGKKKSFVYLLFFTIFYIYLYKVLDYTILQFQLLLFLKQFVPDLMLNGQTAEKSVNFIPLITLKADDVRTSLLNILLTMPFGFGLPFVTILRMKKVVIVGLLLSIAIEFLQLTGIMAHMTFRVADVNDVLFNTIGVAIGYMFFVGFVRICRQLSRNRKISANPLLRYIVDRQI